MKNERLQNLKQAARVINGRGKVFVTTHANHIATGTLALASVGLEFCVIDEADIPESIQTAQDFEEYIEAEMAIRLLRGRETPRSP